jgi:hypothetical protein
MEQRGITHVIMETDSKSVVDEICHFRGGISEFSFLISQINNILFCNPNFEVKFIKRQTNMVAHTRLPLLSLIVVVLNHYLLYFDFTNNEMS